MNSVYCWLILNSCELTIHNSMNNTSSGGITLLKPYTLKIFKFIPIFTLYPRKAGRTDG